MSSIIQTRFGEDAYAITRLVLDRSTVLKLSRTDLVRRFGYRDLTSGHAALGGFLLTGIVPPFIAGKLAHALEIGQDLIGAVLIATGRQLHDEARSRILARNDAYRAAFRPHLQVQTERRIPSPIFVAALMTTRRLRILPLPDEGFPAAKRSRDRFIKRAIVEHYRDSTGRVPAFGRITGYVLVLLAGYDGVDFGLPFDVCGDPAGPMRETRRLPEATSGTKRGDTRLTGMLKRTRLKVIQMEGFRSTRRGATDA